MSCGPTCRREQGQTLAEDYERLDLHTRIRGRHAEQENGSARPREEYRLRHDRRSARRVDHHVVGVALQLLQRQTRVRTARARKREARGILLGDRERRRAKGTDGLQDQDPNGARAEDRNVRSRGDPSPLQSVQNAGERLDESPPFEAQGADLEHRLLRGYGVL
jgi:hypothetical protein